MKLEKESKFLEYKTGKGKLPTSLWETYSAFANTSGGKIIIGISEPKHQKYEVTGVDNPELRIEEFWNTVTNPNKVSLNILEENDVKIKILNGKNIIEINVPEAEYTKKPIYINGHKELAYKRLGETDKKATDEEFKYMIINSQEDIDNELLENFDLEDLNKVDIQMYKALLVKNTGDEKYTEMPLEDFLIEVGVLRRNRKNLEKNEYLLTVGGLLFFGKYNSITDKYPKFQIDYFKKKNTFDINWTDRVSTGDKDYPDMNVFSFYLKVMEKLSQSIENRFNLNENMTRDSYYNDINKMLREVLTNTLVHAYYGGDKIIKIIHYNDYWEFYNPGNMRITKTEFIHGGVSKVRNSVISTLFRKIGFVEKAGSGGPRIFDTVNKYRLRTPEMELSDMDTSIKIWKLEPMDYYQNRNDIEKKILEIILKDGYITRKSAGNNNISEHNLKINLKKLIEDNILIKDGKGRSTKYIFKRTEEAFIQQIKKMLVRLNDEIKNLSTN